MRKVTQRSVEKNLTTSPLISIQECKIDLHVFLIHPCESLKVWIYHVRFLLYSALWVTKHTGASYEDAATPAHPFPSKCQRHDTLNSVPQRGYKSIVGSRMIRLRLKRSNFQHQSPSHGLPVILQEVDNCLKGKLWVGGWSAGTAGEREEENLRFSLVTAPVSITRLDCRQLKGW